MGRQSYRKVGLKNTNPSSEFEGGVSQVACEAHHVVPARLAGVMEVIHEVLFGSLELRGAVRPRSL